MKKNKISYWDYRILKKNNLQNVEEYGIIKTYYDSNNKPIAYTDWQIPWGETLKDLKIQLSSMLKSCRQNVLTEEDFKQKRKKHVKSILDE